MKSQLLVIFLTIASCHYHDDRLVIKNESDDHIYVAFSTDTTLTLGKNRTFMIPDYYIKANSERNIINKGSQKEWERDISKSAKEKLHIFILSEKVLERLSAKDIEKHQSYMSRIDISLKDLNRNNWIVKHRK